MNAPVLGDRARDGVIETTVQRANVIRADGRIHFHRQPAVWQVRDRPLMLPVVGHRAAEGVFREDDREGHAVPPRLPRGVGRIGAERHRSSRLRVEMECADQVVTHDQCTCARSQVPFFGRALLRIAFDHDDA